MSVGNVSGRVMKRAAIASDVSLSNTELRRLLALAKSAAREGGDVARRAFGRRLSVRIKHDHSEVTQIDEAAQAAVLAHLAEHRPHDRFVGEESDGAAAYGFGELATRGGKSTRRSALASSKRSAKPIAAANSRSRIQDPKLAVTWVVDPIDGTRNFIRGVPMFTCSVAAMVGGLPVVGAIFDPISGVMFSAALGLGARRDGVRLPPIVGPRSSRSANHEPAAATRSLKPVIAIPSAWRNDSGPFVRRLLETSVVRSLGSGTLHLVYVALGGFDATYMNNCKLWDIAAGALIVTEVGGRVTDPRGKPLFPMDLDAYRGEEMPTLASRGDESSHRLMP